MPFPNTKDATSWARPSPTASRPFDAMPVWPQSSGQWNAGLQLSLVWGLGNVMARARCAYTGAKLRDGRLTDDVVFSGH